MIVDQDEIEALLAEADSLRDAAEAAPDAGAELSAHLPASGVVNTQAPPKAELHSAPAEVKRLLRVRVPVIARLAERPMTIGEIRNFSVGAIIEFEKSVDDDLDMYIRNRCIGKGTAVKVGDRFGMRVTAVDSKHDRVRSLG